MFQNASRPNMYAAMQMSKVDNHSAYLWWWYCGASWSAIVNRRDDNERCSSTSRHSGFRTISTVIYKIISI